jgi:hypothetical protein
MYFVSIAKAPQFIQKNALADPRLGQRSRVENSPATLRLLLPSMAILFDSSH